MEIIGLIISIFALIFSLFTYFYHDIKIKKQEQILNAYQINEIKEKTIAAKKAIIEANTIKINPGKNILKIYNKGLALAKNVNLIFTSTDDLIMTNNPFPIDLKPQQSVDITFLLSTGCPEKVKIGLQWDDDYKENNIEYQYIQIL
jgi:hypothetical protein